MMSRRDFKLEHGLAENIIGGFLAFISVAAILGAIIGDFSSIDYLQVMPNLLQPSTLPLPGDTTPFKIAERYGSFDGYFDIYDVVIREDDSPCTFESTVNTMCGDIIYSVELTVN